MPVLRDGAGRFRTEGRRLLLDVLKHERQVEVARKVRCSQSVVSRLASGEKLLTDLDVSLLFQEKYGIPSSAWRAEVAVEDEYAEPHILPIYNGT